MEKQPKVAAGVCEAEEETLGATYVVDGVFRCDDWDTEHDERILISVPPHVPVSNAVQYIKWKSSRKLQQEYARLKKRHWGQHMWSMGYFAVTTGTLNTTNVQKYIEEQEMHPD